MYLTFDISYCVFSKNDAEYRSTPDDIEVQIYIKIVNCLQICMKEDVLESFCRLFWPQVVHKL